MAKKRIPCLNEALCYLTSSVLTDSLLLRNSLPRQAPKWNRQFTKLNIMKKNIFIIAFHLLSFYSFACLNGETKVLKNGVYIYEDYKGIVPRGHNFYIENYPHCAKSPDFVLNNTYNLNHSKADL